MNDKQDLQTVAVNYGVASNKEFGAIIPPLYLSSTYEMEEFGKKGAYDYGRSGNPNRSLLAEALAKLEGGARSVITSSGMAAVDLVLALLEPGDMVVAPHDCYGGTYRLLSARAAKKHIDVTFINFYEDHFESRLPKSIKLFLIETPTNPLLRLIDIAKISGLAKRYGAWLAVDNTFLSPALQRPLSFGADFAIHSTTKLINGHSDVVGGAVICADAAHHEKLLWWANCTGVTGSPFDSYLTLRGLRTLHVRANQQQATASFLAGQISEKNLAKIYYPGLTSHADHALMLRQQQGPGFMLSFEMAGGISAVKKFLKKLHIIKLAQSLGGTESLICHPATMTHAAMPEAVRHQAGITDGLLRLSVGLEAPQDLLQDLLAGFSE
ncbi:MAG: cystathionine gamma-synthase [Pseudomonadota bacterium]